MKVERIRKMRKIMMRLVCVGTFRFFINFDSIYNF
jgi:hypothetical protein